MLTSHSQVDLCKQLDHLDNYDSDQNLIIAYENGVQHYNDNPDNTTMSSTLADTLESFGNNKYELVSEISRQAWGHPELFFKQQTFPDVGNIEYVDLGKYLSSIRLCIGEVNLGHVIVRDEYRIALEALQQPLYARGAYVTGQPGIGKYRTMCGVSFSLSSTLT